MAFVIMDIFAKKMTSEVKEVEHENKILVTNVPAYMTRLYQNLIRFNC